MVTHGKFAKILFTVALAAVPSMPADRLSAQDARTPKIERVGAVYVKGNKNVATQTILSMIRTLPGTEYNPGTLYDDITILLESGLLKSVRPREERTMGGVVVTFHVMEYPNVIAGVDIRHARHTNRVEILEILENICEGMPMAPTLNKNACFKIQDYLKRKGRCWANVSLEEGAFETDKRVIFNISEGPIVRVRSIKFLGGGQLAGPKDLLKQIDSTAQTENDGGVYNGALIDNDVHRLQQYFIDRGFRSAQVERELIFSDDLSRVEINFHIHEGRRQRIMAINIVGARTFTAGDLQRIVQTQPGEFLSTGRLKADECHLAEFFRKHGLEAEITAEVFEVPDHPEFVQIHYEVNQLGLAQKDAVGNEVTGVPPALVAPITKKAPRIFIVLPVIVVNDDGTITRETAPAPDIAEPAAGNPFDQPDNLPGAVKEAYASGDEVRLGQALASLKEPSRHGGTRAQQDLYVSLLLHAVTEARQPLARMGAMRALKGYEDPRAAKALVKAYLEPPPFSPDMPSKIKIQTLSSLANTRTDAARELLLLVANQPPPAPDCVKEERMRCNDQRLAALRGLASFQGPDIVDALVKMLRDEKSVAVRNRAQMTLKTITGKNLPLTDR